MLNNSDGDNPVGSDPMQAKKSFILHKDLLETFKDLEDSEAANLIRAIFEYQNGLGIDRFDRTTKLLMSQVIQTFKREDEKWLSIRDRNVANGKKGGRPPKEINPVGSLGTQNNPEDPKKAVSVRVNGNVIVKEQEVSETSVSSRPLPAEDGPKPHRINGAKKAKPVPYAKIFELFALKCRTLGQPRIIDAKRKAGAKRLWGRSGGTRDEDKAWLYIGILFAAAQDSPFLRGEKSNGEHRNWKADFDFVAKDATITKIMEGGYAE